MQTTPKKLLHWNADQITAFGRKAMVCGHRLQDVDLFSDDELISVLENHPRDQLQAFTMGTDDVNIRQWQAVEIGDFSGKELLAAVAKGRLWFHIFRMQKFNPRYAELQTRLFEEIQGMRPDFKPFNPSSTLIISSPSARVYYHADPQFNLLWHVRGTKRVWSYPPNDPDLIDQQLMEDIFASFADEEVPYKPDFDRKAQVFELKPGEVISWGLNAPHRVINLTDINVSLSTVYETDESDRRKLIYNANRLFRRSYSIPCWSTRETGLGASIKRFAFRAMRKAGMVQTPPRRAYVTNLRIDPLAMDGVRKLSDGPVLTQFSKQEFKLEKNAVGEVAAVPHKP